MRNSVKLLDSFTLKMVMAALMLLDHVWYFLPGQPLIFHILGRAVAPTFCYLMTVSLHHTRDRSAFIRRLFAAGIIMYVGSTVLTYSLQGPIITNTIFLSLAVGAAMIESVEKLSNGRGGAGTAICLIFLVILTLADIRGNIYIPGVGSVNLFFKLEGRYLLPVYALIFYYLGGKKPVMCAAFIITGILMVNLRDLSPIQHYQILAVIPITMYNGMRGRPGPFAKWFFYIFYPLHIWILYIIVNC